MCVTAGVNCSVIDKKGLVLLLEEGDTGQPMWPGIWPYNDIQAAGGMSLKPGLQALWTKLAFRPLDMSLSQCLRGSEGPGKRGVFWVISLTAATPFTCFTAGPTGSLWSAGGQATTAARASPGAALVTFLPGRCTLPRSSPLLP